MSSNLKLCTKFTEMLAEVSLIYHPTFHWREDIYLPRQRWVAVANCSRKAGPSGWRWRRDLPCLESPALPVSCKSDPGNVYQETWAYCWSFLPGCSQHSKYQEPYCIPVTFWHCQMTSFEIILHSAQLITLALSMTSGARYHLVATYSVRTPVWSCEVSHTRASPKSQI